MIKIKAIKHLCVIGFFAFLILKGSGFSQITIAPIEKTITFQSMATAKYVVTWDEGIEIDLHASANKPDSRTLFDIVDANNGYIALRSHYANKYLAINPNKPNNRIEGLSDTVSENTLFSWVGNNDGTFSLRSKINGHFVSVVREDTTIVPYYDSATIANHSVDKTVSGENTSSLVITPDMLKPYTVSFFILHASGLSIGNNEKFILSAPTLKKQAATGRLSKVLTYMYDIIGTKTICGIHNREPNSNPAQWTNWIYNQTGKYPGLWGGDFLFESDNVANRGTMINEAKNQWSKGAVVNLMYHMCPPTQGESCGWDGGVKSKLSDDQWKQLTTDGTSLNNTFKQRMKSIGTHFKTLKDAGVEVIFRPFHEMNQADFWWGGRTGPTGTSRLFQIAHDYLVDTLGLTNVFFIWSIQDLSWNFSDYNPGDEYWDLMTMDVYAGDGFTAKKYNAMLDIAGDRLIGIAETGKVPTSAELKAQPRWVYFSGWSELTNGDIKGSYGGSDNTVSRDKMPGWNNVVAKPIPVVGIAGSRLTARHEPEFGLDIASRSIRFSVPQSGIIAISLHNAVGQTIQIMANRHFTAGSYSMALPMVNLQSGVYFIRISMNGTQMCRKLGIVK